MSRLNFCLEKEASLSRARAANFTTLHGKVQTPIFMPVGTQATVKTQSPERLRTSGSHVLLANTYHLMLRPGPEVFQRMGGIHKFMSWDGPVLTDSGGFQIFSLPNSRRINEEGASFQSYVDGRTHVLSPEESIRMQRAIGSDIMMVLDQCVPSTVERSVAIQAMELTHRWAARSLEARGNSPQALFGIVQGACFPDLRRKSAECLTSFPFDGFAIGGLAVGELKEQREDVTERTTEFLPKFLPRYLMGVGTPLDLLEAVHRGVDMFDCIVPSQLAQRGAAFTSFGRLQLRREQYKFSDEKLDPDCPCSTCSTYSRAYLHHLYKTGETLGWKLLTHHNLTFYHRLMKTMRAHILADTFSDFYHSQREVLARSDNSQTGASRPKRSRAIKVMLGDYAIQTSDSGFFSIRQLSSGETMHPGVDPTDEANRLYVQQSRLAERLRDAAETDSPLVLWDVGLGAGTNAMAVIRCFEDVAEKSPVRQLMLTSFERDMDPLRLALSRAAWFRHLHHRAPKKLLDHGVWESPCGRLVWQLRQGDFTEVFEDAPRPDLVYYDPFSGKTDVGMWERPLFERLFRFCSPGDTELYTYTASTAIRAAFLSVGFYVGAGFSTGKKSETTVATTRFLPGVSYLEKKWLDRWERSQAKFPIDLDPSCQMGFEASVRGHQQFLN